MRVVVENIRKAMVQSRREVYLVFVYPVLRAFTDTVPFLSMVRKSPWYRIYKVVPSRKCPLPRTTRC